jgi:molecular chaperone HscB
MNYFELFDLPVAPSIDKSELEKKYFGLQKNSHPDFFTQGTEEEKEQAVELSASINKAFNIFKYEEKTIEYFLQLKGLIEPDEKYNLPPGFLMEMMEINESLADDPQKIVVERVEDYETALKKEIQPIIDNYDPIRTTEGDLLKLKEYYYKKKYLKRILDRLDD